jgi:hypothetical protein
MKRIIILMFLCINTVAFAQVNISHPPIVDRTNSNVFLDASINFSPESGATNNVGKGIVFPSVNLINFEFNSDFLSSTDSPSFYNGMIVYNNTSGTTLTTGNRSSLATVVTPGFYYYSNPNGATNENVTGGEWKALGGSSSTTDFYTTDGSLSGNRIVSLGTNNLTFSGAGKVGIGVSPTSKLEVAGAATNNLAFNAGSSASIDFSNSNLAYTSASGTAITLTNIKDGGAYTLILTSTAASSTAAFTAAGFTFKNMGTIPRTLGKTHMYSFLVVGSEVYVSMATEN